MRKIIFIIFATSCFFSFSEEAGDRPKIIVKASRNELIYLNQAEIVQVIDREEIETIKPSTTGELLDYATGVSISTGTGSGFPDRSVVSLNGLPPNYTLVLVDGVPLLSEHIHTGQNIELIPPECIERIEMMRGAASAQYGSDAIGGVVNIITRKWMGKPYGSVGFSVGSYDTYEGNINLKLPLGTNASLSTSASWEKSDGIPLKEPTRRIGKTGYERFSLFNRVDVHLSDTTEAYATLHNVWSWMEWNDEMPKSTLVAPSIGLTQEINPMTTLSARLNLSEWEAEVNGERNRVVNPEAHLTRIIGESHILMVGGDGRWNEFERTSVNAPDQRACGLFIQDEWIPNDQFTLMGALRYDKVDGVEGALSPKISMLYTPTDRVALRASLGRGFHAPTLMELYEEGYGHGGRAYRFGNPDLEPEYSTTLTTGLEVKPVDSLQLSVYGFYTEFENMIVPVYEGASTVNTNIDVWRRTNIEEAIVYGVETAAKWKPCDRLALEGGYTWTENEDQSTGRSLPYSPGSSAFAKLTLTENISTNLTVTGFFGARATLGREAWNWKPAAGSSAGNADGLTTSLDDYIKLDMGLSVQRGDLTVFVKVENLLGEDIENLDDCYTVLDGEPFFRIGLQYNLPFLN